MVRQAERKAAHRNAILDAAEEVLGETTGNVSIEDIAGRAGLAKGTVYNHFQDKTDLLREVAARVRTIADEAVLLELEGIDSAPERLARGMSVYVRLALSNPRRGALLVRIVRDAADPASPINAALRSEIERGNARGELDALPIEAGVMTILALVRAAMTLAMRGGGDATDLRAAYALVRNGLRALGVPSRTIARIPKQVFGESL